MWDTHSLISSYNENRIIALGTFLESVAQYPRYSPLTPFSLSVRRTISFADSLAPPAAPIPDAYGFHSQGGDKREGEMGGTLINTGKGYRKR